MGSGGVLLASSCQDLLQALNKKQTFEGTCQSLAERAELLGTPEIRPLLARSRTLLRSRFTTRPFWVAGRELFRAALAQAGGDAPFRRQLEEYIAECDEFLGEAAGTSASAESVAAGAATAAAPADSATAAMFAGVPPPAAGAGYLFEGQLSGAAGQSPPRPQPSLMDLLSGALAQQLVGSQAQAQAQQPGADHGVPSEERQQQQGGAAEEPEQAEQQQGDAAQEPEQAEQQQLAPEALAAIEAELDAIAVRLMEETGQAAAAQRSAPPASKRVVASLPKESLTEERLGQLGGPGTRCPVCMDELSVGDEVQVMPCRHVFHPPCLAPWLADNNSCPTCRHELPTDDWRYEDRKERARVEEEERRGAANAVSHNEFLYI